MRVSTAPLDDDATSPRHPERLRVALLVDSVMQPQWVYDIVREIQRSSYASIALIVENGDTGGARFSFALPFVSDPTRDAGSQDDRPTPTQYARHHGRA